MDETRKHRDLLLLAALAAGKSHVDAAVEAGVSESTVRRRLRNPRFAAKLARLQSRILKHSVASLNAASGEAVATMVALLNCSHDPTRLGAARSILELGPKLRETTEFAEKFHEVEEKLNRLLDRLEPPTTSDVLELRQSLGELDDLTQKRKAQ